MPTGAEELNGIVRDALDAFYKRRIDKLSSLKLRDILRRKNPYLFRAVGIGDANEMVEQLLSAFMSSSDESIFGNEFFEPVVRRVTSGIASPTEGADIVIETATQYKAIAVKSGKNVFNKQSKTRQGTDFNALRSRMYKTQKQFDAVVGYCYGRKSQSKADKGFREIAGQELWEELTGDSMFYLKILEAMKEKPAEHKSEFKAEWDKAKNRFLRELTTDFCDPDGAIDWPAILRFNSAKALPDHGKKAKYDRGTDSAQEA